MVETNNPTAPATDNATVVKQALAKATKPGTLAGLNHTNVQTVLNSMKAQIAQALPKHLTPDRMIQMACTLIQRNPAIAECTATSLMGAVMQASILGFRPVDTLGECYFVPYNRNTGTRERPVWQKEVQMQIGYKGYISLARRSGEIKMIYAEVVREGDEFTVEYGLNPVLKHVPLLGNESSKVLYVYAVAHYNDGGYNFVCLTTKQIEALRKRNPMQKEEANGAWKTDWEAMAKAKAIKQLSKYMPLSVDMQDAVMADEAVISDKAFSNDRQGLKPEAFEYAEIVENPQAEPGTAPEPKHETGPSPIDDLLVMEQTTEKKKK